MKRPNITIQVATAQDYHPLCELFQEVDALHQYRLPDIFQAVEISGQGYEYFLNLIADEHVALFTAKANEVLVGFVHAVIQSAPNAPVFVPRRYALVVGIAVRSDYRDSGIGRILMERVHQWATSKGATSIELNIYEFNTGAIRFYERLGYHTLSRCLHKRLDDQNN